MSTNKTITKNAAFLYLRMILVLCVSLYTSRIVLNELGISDYGIYSLVGGFIALFTFFNGAMSTATQRYLSYDLGTNNYVQLQKTFSATLTIHSVIALIVLLLSETVGLWYVNHIMVYPPERTYAVNVVYQFSILTTLFSIVQIPYTALLIAREKMNIFAFISIIEVMLKLGIVFSLALISIDKLISYSILTFIVTLIIRMSYQIYCRKNYTESKYKFEWDYEYYKELIQYSGWNLLGQLANMFANQGIGLVFNLFYGVVINTTIHIANQVNTAIYSFVSNFQLAFNPQITKTYANHELQEHKKLVLTASKFSLIIMLIIASPVLLLTKPILVFWLGSDLPEYVVQFVQIILLCSLIDALSGPFWTSIYAIGKVKKYNLAISLINIMTLPIIYLLLKVGVKVYFAFTVKFVILILIQTFRYYYVNKYLKFSYSEFFTYFWRVVLLLCVSIGISLSSYHFVNNTLSYAIVVIILLESSILSFTVFVILTKPERLICKSFILKKIKNNG